MNKITFQLKTEYIHMIQLLKAVGLAESGGMAKHIVEDGLVKYNGEIDYRKRLKVRKGDSVEFTNYLIKII